MFPSSGRTAIALLAASLALPAAAADDDFFGLGAHALLNFTDEADDDVVLALGAQVRLRPFRRFALEGAVSYRDDEFAGGLIEAKTYPIQASGLLFLLTGRLELYALGGVTYLVIDAEEELFGNDEVLRVPGFHAGGGIEAKLYGPWRLHADARYLVADDELAGRTIDYDTFLVNAGISFWW